MKSRVFRNLRVASAALAGVFAIALVLAATGHVTANDETALGTFTTIDFPGATSTSGMFAGINPRGDITGSYIDADGRSHGFLLSEGEFTSIDFPGAINTFPNKINPRGDIVGSYDDVDGRRHGFLLNEGQFTSIDFPDAISTLAFGMNPRGDIVGWYDSADHRTHGWLLTRRQPDNDMDNNDR